MSSIKHVVDVQGGITSGSREVVILATGVDSPSTSSTTEVQTGGRVNSLYLNVQVLATTSTALPNFYLILYKNPGNNVLAAQIPEANAVGTSDFRKQVFHQEMRMMSQENDSIPITMFNGVLKLPQRFQRMGINDTVVIQFISPGVDVFYCIQCIYKEYR